MTTGVYIRDGVMATVVSGTRRAERGRDGRVLRQVIDCVEDQDFMTFRHYRRYWKRLLDKDPGLLNCLPTPSGE